MPVHVPEVIGLLAVDRPARSLASGPLAGRFGWQPVCEWKHGLSAVAAADLGDELIEALGLRHPAATVRADQPRVRAALEALPLLAIHPTLWDPLAEAGCRLLRFGYHRGNAALQLETTGPGWPGLRFEGYLPELWDRGLGGGAREAIDRLLRAATDGAAGELAVRAADFVGKQVDRLLVTEGRPAERRRALADHVELLAGLDPDLAADLGADLHPDPPLWNHAGWEAELSAEVEPAGRRRAAALVAELEAARGPGRASVGRVPFALHRLPAVRCDVSGVRLELPPVVVARRRGR